MEPGSAAKVPPPVTPLKYLSKRRLMMPLAASTPAISCRVPGIRPTPMSFPLRSVGPLPASSSAAASRCPDRCAGMSSVPYVVVPATVNETLRLTAATCPELHAASPAPSATVTATTQTARARTRMSRTFPYAPVPHAPMPRYLMPTSAQRQLCLGMNVAF